MRHQLMRPRLLTLITLVALAGLFAPGLAAQEATPGPITATELAPGFTVEVFAGVPSARAPQQTVYVTRFIGRAHV